LNLPSIELAGVIDTLAIARRTFPGARANLDALCKRFKVDNTNRQFHGALKDAYLLSEIYVELSGGRQVRFSLKEMNGNILKPKQNIQYTGKGNKIVVIPTNSELKEHNAFLAKFINLKTI
jgi:DNA polymerase-3 subunit epsilon